MDIFSGLRRGISIHTVREDDDPMVAAALVNADGFQSTPSVRTMTKEKRTSVTYGLFQSTPSVRTMTHNVIGGSSRFRISIHTVREDDDSGLAAK